MTVSSRAATSLVGLVLAASAFGCGDGEDDAQTGPAPGGEASFPEPERTTAAVADKLQARMPREKVLRVIGIEPVLTQASTTDFPGGCDFFAFEGLPVENVLQVCFDERGLSLVLTAYYQAELKVPPDASPTRHALLGRGSTICQAEGARRQEIEQEVSKALADLGKSSNAAVRAVAAAQMRRLVANLEKTHEQLAAFEAPEDGGEALAAYLTALSDQARLLDEMRAAVAAGEPHAALIDEINTVGGSARDAAREYGFSGCEPVQL